MEALPATNKNFVSGRSTVSSGLDKSEAEGDVSDLTDQQISNEDQV